MQDPRNIAASSAGHDGSLVDWFSTLSPEQRLAELESRISFFHSLRLTDESELSHRCRWCCGGNPGRARHLLLMTRAGPLDVLGFIGDSERYEDLIAVSSEVAMTIGRFHVLDLEELVRQKQATGRPKDLAVLEILKEVLRRRNDDN